MSLSASDVSLTPQSALPKMEKVAILDCGAQYTKVIDRRVRELNLESDIVPLSIPAEALKDYQAIILSGGPNSVFATDAPPFDPAILQLGIPVLGICYGMQLMAYHLGGTVLPSDTREFGETIIEVDTAAPLFHTLPPHQQVLMSHGDKVVQLPPEFIRIGLSKDFLDGDIVAAMMHPTRPLYGVQFHPEVELTTHGAAILKNFLYNVAGLKGEFKLDRRLEESLSNLRRTIGTRPVLVLVSGGVDSAVTAALLIKALPADQVYALHIDTGFMRDGESALVCEALGKMGLTHLEHRQAQEEFLTALTDIDGQIVGPLCTVTDPEIKRRIIGDTFLKLTQDAILAMNLDLDQTFIAQGTLRPDLIESGNVGVSVVAHKIKTHHNDVPLIQAQREKGLIVETNRDWHKDEVRQIGAMLGLPDEIVHRQPFPGPGLAIRILCAEAPYHTPEFLDLNDAVHKEAQKIGLSGHVLPVQSVGVQGDYRTYSYLAAISGDYSQDWDLLKSLAVQLPNQHRTINRVALVLNRPTTPLRSVVNTITPTHLSPITLDLLRAIDRDVTGMIRDAGLLEAISQLLCVLLPVDLREAGQHSIAIRAVVTSDYMTARPARLGDELPWVLMDTISSHIITAYPISSVLYDLTSKPPATVEWE